MSGQSGFTLVELMVTITIALTTIAGGVSLLGNAGRRSDEAQRRADATLRARVAIDTMTKDLRSQVCRRDTPTSLPLVPIVAGTATSVTFYVDFEKGTHQRSLSLDAATGVLTERIWANAAGTGTPQTRTLGTNMAPGNGSAVFTYYGFDAATGAADAALSPPLSATTRSSVARISIALRALPPGTKQDGTRVTPITDDVFVRLVDPDGSAVAVCA